MKTFLLLGTAILTLSATPAFAGAAPIAGVKNIIIIINDGGGPTVYDATRMFLGKPLTTDGAGFKKTFVSTYPLRSDSTANNQPGSTVQDPAVIYDPAKYWDPTPVAGVSAVAGYANPFGPNAGFSPIPGTFPAAFRGYEFSRFAHPDSGNTASSIANGIKSYNNSINVDGAGNPQVTITDVIDAAKTVGKGTGVVSTVSFADATPAALGGAHNIARSNRTAIAFEMFSSGKLDVIAGPGNPDYNDDGILRATPAYTWVSQALWTDLKGGTNASGGNAQKWKLLQDKEPIEALAAKKGKPPLKLAMIIKGDNSSQFNRTNTVTVNGTPINATQDTVYGTPLKTNVPSQTAMTLAALNALDQNGRGFYLMSEAGAVDRAEHANNTARTIEEQIESDNTVQAIIDWVNRPDTAATWNNTLLIITADHDHLLFGPQADTVFYQPLVDNGPGQVPGNRWFGPNHGTGLVPLYAYGKGAADVVALANKTDSVTVNGVTYGNGAYLDQTELGAVLKLTAQQAQ
jgi:alkaline phosphatase